MVPLSRLGDSLVVQDIVHEVVLALHAAIRVYVGVEREVHALGYAWRCRPVL